MTPFQPGDQVTYLWHIRGGYGYTREIKAEVIKAAGKRVHIRVWRVLSDGTTVPEDKLVNPRWLQHNTEAVK